MAFLFWYITCNILNYFPILDDVPEPELRELWSQLFRVMDDIHEGTRLAAQGTAAFLSKVPPLFIHRIHLINE